MGSDSLQCMLVLILGCALAFLEHFPLWAGAGLKALGYTIHVQLACSDLHSGCARQGQATPHHGMSLLQTDLSQGQMPASVNGTSLYTVFCVCRTAAEHHHLQRVQS